MLKEDCSYCAQKLDLGILLFTAVLKLLGWYRAVLDGMSDTSAIESSTTQRESVSMTPIILGDFQLDRTAENRMKAQLLLCELQNVVPLLDLLEERNSRVSSATEIYSPQTQQLRTLLTEMTAQIDVMVVSGSK